MIRQANSFTEEIKQMSVCLAVLLMGALALVAFVGAFLVVIVPAVLIALVLTMISRSVRKSTPAGDESTT